MAASTKQAKKSRPRRREEGVENLWKKPAGEVEFGREAFRFVLTRRKRDLPRTSLDPLIEHIDWSRNGAVLMGEMNLRTPHHTGPREARFLVAKGDEVLVYVSTWGRGRWRELRRLEVHTDPEWQVEDGLLSMSLRSSTKAIQKSRVGWKFRKDKRHPKGWTANEIAEFAAGRFGIPIGTLASASHRIRRLNEKKASVLDIVTRAYKMETQETGQKFLIDLADGKLDVIPLRHPEYMHVLGPSIVSMMQRQSLTGFATTLIVTGKVRSRDDHDEPDGRSSQKLTVRVSDPERRRIYGEIVKTVEKDGLASRAALEAWGKRELARMRRPRRDITFTHPGIPFLDRGDALRLSLPEADLLVTCYVKSVRHTISAGSYDMEVTVGFTDPWLDEKKKKVEKKKAQAQRRRGRQRGESHPLEPRRNRRRGDTHTGGTIAPRAR